MARSRLLWLAFSLLTALALLGCGDSSSSGTPSGTPSNSSATTTSPGGGKKLVVGFAQEGAESNWRTAETASIKEEAEKRGVDLRFVDAQQKAEAQIAALRSFISQKVDAIILAPKVNTGWDPVLREVKAANIPVILVDRGIETSDPSLYVTLIASNFVDEGRRAAEWLAKKTNGKANIVELQGSVGADPAIERKKGFEEGIAKFPGMKIIDSQSGDFNRTKGKEVMEAFLKKDGKNINAVYAHNDEMALGAMQAIEEAGFKPGKDILIVSIDGQAEALKEIVNGNINCVVECPPMLGPAAFDALQAALDKKSVEKRITQKDNLFDSANAAGAIEGRKY